MIIFPAVDLYSGKAVRLLHGDYRQMTVYSDDPFETALRFQARGAEYIHMVDLEGARDGAQPNFSHIARVAGDSRLRVQAGGGIRSMEAVERLVDAGVFRVILGTAAVEDPALLDAALARFGEKIAVGADVRDGFIAVQGWLRKSELRLEAFVSKMRAAGVKTLVCTDISRDGAMRGANLALCGELSKSAGMDIVASGGVSTQEDVRRLRELGLYGAIAGKAIYTGDLSLESAIEVAR